MNVKPGFERIMAMWDFTLKCGAYQIHIEQEELKDDRYTRNNQGDGGWREV